MTNRERLIALVAGFGLLESGSGIGATIGMLLMIASVADLLIPVLESSIAEAEARAAKAKAAKAELEAKAAKAKAAKAELEAKAKATVVTSTAELADKPTLDALISESFGD